MRALSKLCQIQHIATCQRPFSTNNHNTKQMVTICVLSYSYHALQVLRKLTNTIPNKHMAICIWFQWTYIYMFSELVYFSSIFFLSSKAYAVDKIFRSTKIYWKLFISIIWTFITINVHFKAFFFLLVVYLPNANTS